MDMTSGPSPLVLMVTLIVGMSLLMFMHAVHFLGIEWVETLWERVIRKIKNKDDSEDDPTGRGGYA